MTTPAGETLPDTPPYARSRASATELAAGLIKEEQASQGTGETDWRELFAGPPTSSASLPPTRLERVRTATSRMIRRITSLGTGPRDERRTYAQVVDGLSLKKQREVGSAAWALITKDQQLMRDYDSKIPHTMRLVEQAGIVANTQYAIGRTEAPKLQYGPASVSRSPAQATHAVSPDRTGYNHSSPSPLPSHGHNSRHPTARSQPSGQAITPSNDLAPSVQKFLPSPVRKSWDSEVWAAEVMRSMDDVMLAGNSAADAAQNGGTQHTAPPQAPKQISRGRAR
ncbi:hypothetical protein RKD31_000757 [Streptomyces sp. SAI-163]